MPKETQTTAYPGIATPESDAELAREWRARGARDREKGVRREDCPVQGLIANWWLEGYDGTGPFEAHPLTA